MCGLVGVAGDIGGTWKDIFNELLVLDYVRGPHSTGAAWVNRTDSKITVVKRIGHPFNLICDKEYDEAHEKGPFKKVALGHNRFATVGGKSEENAHPFAFEHVVGAHNGTLEKFCLYHLDDYEVYDTDSEAIFATINRVGVKETIKNLSGAWALTWFDKLQNTLNFLNNGKRPLHYCYSKDRCTIIWASEAVMLRYVMKRNKRDILDDKVYSVTPDKHFVWNIPKFVHEKFGNPTQELVEGKKWEAVKGYNYAPFGTHSSTSSGGSSKTTTATVYDLTANNSNLITNMADFSKRIKTAKFRPPYRDDFHHTLNKVQFHELTEEGCSFCSDSNTVWGQFIKILGPYKGKLTPYVCETCYNDEEIFSYLSYAM